LDERPEQVVSFHVLPVFRFDDLLHPHYGRFELVL